MRSRVGVVSRYALFMSQTAFTPPGKTTSDSPLKNELRFSFNVREFLPEPRIDDGKAVSPAVIVPNDCRNVRRDFCGFCLFVLFLIV
jgi:hypothetical protein